MFCSNGTTVELGLFGLPVMAHMYKLQTLCNKTSYILSNLVKIKFMIPLLLQKPFLPWLTGTMLCSSETLEPQWNWAKLGPPMMAHGGGTHVHTTYSM